MQTIDLTHAVNGDLILLPLAEATDINDHYSLYNEFFGAAAEQARAVGILIGLEAVRASRTAQVDRLIRKIDHPVIGLYYDMGNCLNVCEHPLEKASRSADI